MIETKTLLGFDRFFGTVDGLIVYMHRNQRCIRRKPLSVKPPTAPGQLAQQERMASIAIFYHALKSAGIYSWWQKAAEGMVVNGYNLLVKLNLPAFGREGMICDFTKIRITTGTVALPDALRVKPAGDKRWRIEWVNPPCQVNAGADDRLWLYVMKDSETFDVESVATGGVCRQDGGAEFTLPEELADYPHLYVVFSSQESGTCSESKYFNINLNM